MRRCAVLLRVVGVVALSACAGAGPGSGSTTPAPEPTITPTPGPVPTAPVANGNCQGPAPSPGHECVQDCGPPVAQEGDPAPGFSWLSQEDAKSRKQYGCPICLPGGAQIATPDGARKVSALRTGMQVWTLDDRGRRVVGVIEHVGSVLAPKHHQLVRFYLTDGRRVAASAGHPLTDGRVFGDLRSGDRVDGAEVLRVERIELDAARTYDILPSGGTGAYWADAVLVKSSLSNQPRHAK